MSETPQKKRALQRLSKTARVWMKEDRFRKRLLNVGYLFSGNFAAGFLGIAAVAFAARALGPESYGILALMTNYMRFVEKFVSFQAWQALIKFGAQALEEGRKEDFKGLLWFGLTLDLVTLGIGTVLAITGIYLAGGWYHWSQETILMASLYCTALLFRIQSTPVTVLRLFGRFKFFAFNEPLNATIRLALVLYGWWTEQSLWYFVIVWYSFFPLQALMLLTVAWFELRKQGLADVVATPLRQIRGRFKGVLGFAWSTNLSLTIRTSTNELDTLLVGAFTGAADAGFYNIAKRVGRMILQLGVHTQAVLYPEIARFWAKGDVTGFTRAVWQTTAILGLLALVMVVGITLSADLVVHIVAGDQFMAAVNLLIVQTFAAAIYLVGFGLRPALLSAGRQKSLLHVTFWSALAFHASALTLLPLIGAMGANIAHIVSSLVWLVAIALLLSWVVKDARAGRITFEKPQKAAGVDELP